MVERRKEKRYESITKKEKDTFVRECLGRLCITNPILMEFHSSPSFQYVPRILQSDERTGVLEIWSAKKRSHHFQTVFVKENAWCNNERKSRIWIERIIDQRFMYEETLIPVFFTNQKQHLFEEIHQNQIFLRIDSCRFFRMNSFDRVLALSKYLPSCLPYLRNTCDSRTMVSLGRRNRVDIEFLLCAFSVEKMFFYCWKAGLFVVGDSLELFVLFEGEACAWHPHSQFRVIQNLRPTARWGFLEK